MVTEAMQAELKSRLEEEHRRLQADILGVQAIETGGKTGAVPGGGNWDHTGGGNHIADDASEMTQQETAIGLEQNLRTMLSEVERALRKLRSGTYGRCDDCAQPIPEARLQALPYATLCLNCKAKSEKQR